MNIMIYEVRVKKYMSSGSTSLDKYFGNKENAQKLVDQLNGYLPNMYFVQEIKLEDGEET